MERRVFFLCDCDKESQKTTLNEDRKVIKNIKYLGITFILIEILLLIGLKRIKLQKFIIIKDPLGKKGKEMRNTFANNPPGQL